LRIDTIKDDVKSASERVTRILSNPSSDVIGSGNSLQISPKWRLRITDILIAGNLPNHALTVLETLDVDDPKRVKREINARRLMGDHEEAQSVVNSVNEAEMQDHGVMLSAIRLAWDVGDMESVIESCDMLQRLKPNDPVSMRFRLQALVKLGGIQRLRDAVNQALEVNPDNIQALRIAIDIAFSEDQIWKSTIQLSEAVLAIEDGDRRSLCHLAIALARDGSESESCEVIARAKEQHPDDHEVDLAVAEVCRELGDGQGQLDAINEIFSRNGYTAISSSDPECRLNIQHLGCESVKPATSDKLVSIIMTVYGNDELLDIAIDSILNQTHDCLELIVVDDCSEDDAFEHLQQRAELEPRLHAYQAPVNGGTYLAKNFGLSHSKGDFIGFMDSDDWTHPERISRQLAHFDDEIVMGTCDAYFRIDDESHIPYRGKGASRMACISLLARREVLEKNGYFDGLRVGADTEYIERISASFGEGSFKFVNVPTMLMTQHGMSLTGGGQFHISWRSITGARLGHHSSFRAWHRKIAHSGADPYMTHPLRVRPFNAPLEMISGTQWQEGDDRFSELIALRNKRWWSEKRDVWQKTLSPKMRGRRYVELSQVPVPQLIWHSKEMSEIPVIDDLPSNVVIKPSVGWSAKNVFCLINGVNILDGEKYDRERIIGILGKDAFLSRQTPTYMVEELLLPELGRESDGLPRDYKFYCFGDCIAMVHVVLRKSSTDKYANIHHYLDCDLKPIQNLVTTTRPIPEEPFPVPDCWEEMLAHVRTLGRSLKCFMRIDMFATDKGPVFGEFTPTPEGGKGYTEWADKYLAAFWKGIEGADEGSIPEPPEWIGEVA
jgi:glycosyltransferase involved in cell wall biosynthesis/Flp pilus assembly protein TadD